MNESLTIICCLVDAGLSYNNIGDAGLKALSNALRANKSVDTLCALLK